MYLRECLRDRAMLFVIGREDFSLYSVFTEQKKVALENTLVQGHGISAGDTND